MTRLANLPPYDSVKLHMVNPKAVNNGVLYGDYDKATQVI